jgi:hypothetical protein
MNPLEYFKYLGYVGMTVIRSNGLVVTLDWFVETPLGSIRTGVFRLYFFRALLRRLRIV